MIDTLYTVKFKGKTYHVAHGSPFDRGSADSYYGREQSPHKGGVGGDSGPRIGFLTADETREYQAGYAYNEANGSKKDWD